MKSIALLLPRDYRLFSVAAILDVFSTVNSFYRRSRKEAFFDIRIITNSDTVRQYGGKLFGCPIRSYRSGYRADLVLIPGLHTEDLTKTIEENVVLIPWLKRQFASGADMASFCTGSFMFAAAGLLNGKLATTHVDVCPKFILDFPSVYVKPGRTVTVDGRCYTSGGSVSAFHLLILLVQKYCGNEMAIRISKFFAIDLDRYQQSYFSTFRPDYSHNDELVRRVQKKLEANFRDITTIEKVIHDFPASRRNIVRRFKQMTGVPPIQYLQHIRIERAKRDLEQTDHSISEIIDQTGYTDPKSFRKVFRKLVGVTPLEYRRRFGMR
jgi:transcriptional regulator GlxA family with amidase domain